MNGAKLRGGFEWALNIACALLVAYIAVVVSLHYLAPRSTEQTGMNILQIGQKFPLAGVDWSKSQRNLVLAISTECHFCSESAPFYRQLMRNQHRGDWRPIVIAPQTVEQTRSYMHAKSYNVKDVYRAGFSRIGVNATPSLFLVDSGGKIQQQWIGKLSRLEEIDVTEHIGLGKLPPHAPEAAASWELQDTGRHMISRVITTADLVTLMRDDGRQDVVLDVRGRKRYTYGHIAGALNIPVDEIYVRAPHELSPHATVLLYCDFSPACQFEGLQSSCSFAMQQLHQLGINRVRIIRDPLSLLGEAGVPVVGTAGELPRQGRSR